VAVCVPAKAEGVSIVAEHRPAMARTEALAKRFVFMIFLSNLRVDCAVAWPNLKNRERVNA
jgi:hypothetical protein